MRRHPDLVGIATSIRCENGGVVTSREKVLAEVCNKIEYYLGLSHNDLFREASQFQLFKAEQKVRVQPILGGMMFPATGRNCKKTGASFWEVIEIPQNF